MLLQQQDMVQVAAIADKDITSILKIVNYYIQHTTVMFAGIPLNKRELRKKLFPASPVYQAYALKIGNKTIGYCALQPWKAGEAFLPTAEVCIFLEKNERGKGIGAIALSYLEQKAFEFQVSNLMVEVCNENYPALRLLEKYGFARCGRLSEVGVKFDRMLDIIYLKKSFTRY